MSFIKMEKRTNVKLKAIKIRTNIIACSLKRLYYLCKSYASITVPQIRIFINNKES